MKNLPPLEWPFPTQQNRYQFRATYPDYQRRMKRIAFHACLNLKLLEQAENANQTSPQ